MYSLHDYARMIADEVRIEANVRALEATVRPDSVVVDIGTGTGIFAVKACRLGARRVYAIDPNAAIEIAKELALENGCADRITFLQADVREVTLPEAADVIISDLRGGMPLGAGNLAAVAHARKHFLAPEGVLIPQCDTMMMAVVGSARLYERAVGRAGAAGISLTAMRTRLSNSVFKDRSRCVRPADLITAGAPWATIDYRSVVPGPVHGRAEWSVSEDGIGHGLLLWFETVLAAGQGFTTAPGADVVYPQLFLPWPEATSLARGDRVSVELWAQAEGESWAWNTTIASGTRSVRYKQSTFLADLSPPRPRDLRAPAEGGQGR